MSTGNIKRWPLPNSPHAFLARLPAKVFAPARPSGNAITFNGQTITFNGQPVIYGTY